MNRSLRGLAIAWLLLMLLLSEELGTTVLLPGRLAPGVALGTGMVMVVVVGFAFMRLHSSAGLAQAFVVAVLFWLLVLLALGTMDPMTRTDYPVPVTRYP